MFQFIAMNADFRLLLQTRQNLLARMEGLSLEQLNTIPEGFHNNLIWNAAHVLVTQQLLVYKMSGHTPPVSTDWISAYRKGTRPEGNMDAPTWEAVKSELISRVSESWEAYEKGVFRTYTPYDTSYGYRLENVEDAIRFNNAHEAMHLGTVIALSKLI